ncbi:aldose epimerase family protein [Fodinibius salsisoli]|uniref:Aldose 1-epimerase n=1 Tax=Fodinibius salsisoli TaxID=2820877 RepID=A0ABT3PKD2_9BACT|nr:aldose epimerase family protein [Fodinibius salsisoli]MCW9706362.1 galactose mutarotase [Fodinibius salsisoli]
MDRVDFQGTLNDTAVDLYTLTNNNGLKASITNYGARLIELLTPDKEGELDNIIVGHSSMQDILDDKGNFFGAVIGRYANRISEGKFSLDGKEYQLPKNERNHHLHGGPVGFHNVIWGAYQIDAQRLRLSYRSEDGEAGYPGNLGISVTYTLTDEDKLEITFKAESDERTILNMTHHPYYNLLGVNNGGSVDHHLLTIPADQFLEVDQNLLPTGELLSVEGSPLDFNSPKPIGKERQAAHPYLQHTRGYDHNLILNREREADMIFAARVEEPETGRSLEIHTSEPGLQFYTCERPVKGITSAFCLEPQHFPDAPHHDHFPSAILDAYETYRWKTILSLNN